MDDFIADNKIEQIVFLKVNIEGAERLLIRRFTAISRVRHIAISCHDFLGKRMNDDSLFTKQEVSEFLLKNSFDICSQQTGVDYIDDWIYGVNKSLVR
jgi:hypothetical protein